MNLIPQKIHLVFLNKKKDYPDIFKKCIERIKSLHPKWEINVYNEDDADEIIRQRMPYLLSIYNSYKHRVQKADILRVILVYLFGGFYLDMDILCLKPLDNLLRFGLVLGEEKKLTKNECEKLGLLEPVRIANYMFGSTVGHPFWLGFLKEMLKKSYEPIINENDILENTGPGLLSNFFAKNKLIYREILLLRNEDRVCLIQNHNEISCYFGNYAAHLHQGTWRWGANALNNNSNRTQISAIKKEAKKAISELAFMTSA